MLTPTNEQETVIYFATHAEKYGFTILNAQTQFPDALIEKDGKQYKVEFEYLASNFLAHQHDPMKCDLVICWTNDTPDIPLPVIALSQDGWQNMEIIGKDWEVIATYWRQRAEASEERAKQLYSAKQNAIAERDAIILESQTKATDEEKLPHAVPKNEWRVKAHDLVQAQPTMSGAELARNLGCSDRTGQTILKEVENGVSLPVNGKVNL
jgi:hypothetical protein